MTCVLFSRGITLFAIGAVLRMALDLLHVDKYTPTWWLVPVSGIAATFVGLLYPYVTPEELVDPPDGAKVIRCVAVFIGIYQASTKIYFSSYLELFVTLAALAIGTWWLFDRSQSGLIFGTVSSIAASILTHFLCKTGLISTQLVESEFLYSRAGSIYFSATILFGVIGCWVQRLEYG